MTRDPKSPRSFSRPFTDLTNLLRSPSTESTPKTKQQQKKEERLKHSSSSPSTSPNTVPSSIPPPPRSTFQEPFSLSDQYLSNEQEPLPVVTTKGTALETVSIPSNEAQPPPHISSTMVQGTGDVEVEKLSFISEREEEEEEEEEGFEDEDQVEESFVTAIEGTFRGQHVVSPQKATTRTSLGNRKEWTDTVEEEEDEEGGGSPTTTTSFDDSSHLSLSHEEEERTTLDTPDTSFPSTPGCSSAVDSPDLDEEESKSGWLTSALANSSTPSKPTTRPRFVEVVETCPTPEHAIEYHQHTLARDLEEEEEGENDSPTKNRRSFAGTRSGEEEEAKRRRRLFKSEELRHSYYDDAEDDDDAEADVDSIHPTRHFNLTTRYRAPCPPEPYSLLQERSPRSRQSTFASSASTTTSRCPRSPRGDLFPTISATELVVTSLLSSRSLASQIPSPSQASPPRPLRTDNKAQNRVSSYSSNYFDPSCPRNDDPSLPRPIPPSPLKHTRPLSQILHSSPLPLPPSNQISTTTPTHHRPIVVPSLHPKTSSQSLFTYDLSHLPAPRTPLEKPFTVEWKDLLRPSWGLGGGKGSGKYGDRFGAVERKSTDVKSRRRRRSSASLLGVIREGEGEETGSTDTRRVDTPIPESLRRGSDRMRRSGSVRRSLSRWTGFGSSFDLEGINEEDTGVESTGRAREGHEKVRRSQSIRKSLSRSFSSTFSITGRVRGRKRDGERERENENLEQWVNVVIT
ncbi:hypothetical protein JCM16303_004316 [Sporobolomyces ruberrimus]